MNIYGKAIIIPLIFSVSNLFYCLSLFVLLSWRINLFSYERVEGGEHLLDGEEKEVPCSQNQRSRLGYPADFL